jgi:hypothetical protein
MKKPKETDVVIAVVDDMIEDNIIRGKYKPLTNKRINEGLK